MITEHSIFLLTFGDQARRIDWCATWGLISYNETNPECEAMSRVLRVPLAVLEEDGLCIWHRLRPKIASKLNQTLGPARAIWPVKGLLSWESYPNIFCDHETNLNLPFSLNRYLKPQIRAKEFDLHINFLDLAPPVHMACQGQVPERLCRTYNC
jgi:hypothetical protein